MSVLRHIVACAALVCVATTTARADAIEASMAPPPSIADACADLISTGSFEPTTHHCSADGTMIVYTDRAAFLAELEVGHTENDFHDVAPGSSGELRFDDDGFTYRINTQRGAHGLLFNGDGFPSTERALDSLQLTIVPFVRPVNAIGADFFTTDLSVTAAPGTVHIFTGDDVEETVDTNGAPVFRGFIANDDLAGWDDFATGEVDGVPVDRWPAMDNLVLGQHR